MDEAAAALHELTPLVSGLTRTPSSSAALVAGDGEDGARDGDIGDGHCADPPPAPSSSAAAVVHAALRLVASGAGEPARAAAVEAVLALALAPGEPPVALFRRAAADGPLAAAVLHELLGEYSRARGAAGGEGILSDLWGVLTIPGQLFGAAEEGEGGSEAPCARLALALVHLPLAANPWRERFTAGDAVCARVLERFPEPEAAALLFQLVAQTPGWLQRYAETTPGNAWAARAFIKVASVLHAADAPGVAPAVLPAALAVLLCMADDVDFVARMQHVQVQEEEWWTPPGGSLPDGLGALPAGEAAFSALARVTRLGVARLRDEFVVAAALAGMAILAPHLRGMRIEVARRLCGLCQLLSRHVRRPGAEAELGWAFAALLAVINGCVAHRAAPNPNLVYTLLIERKTVAGLRHHPHYGPYARNLEAILAFYEARLQREGAGASVSAVSRCIEGAARELPEEHAAGYLKLRPRCAPRAGARGVMLPLLRR